MTLQIAGVYLLHHIPADSQQGGNILQRGHAEQVHHVSGEAMGIAAAACGKRYLLLLVIAAIVALVTLYLHPYYHLLATQRQTDKVSQPIPVLDQMAISALRTCKKSIFCFHM